MIAPTHMSPERLARERDSFRKSLQLLLQRRETLTERELARMTSVGVSFNPVTRELQWTPVNGDGNVASEWDAYQKSLLVLLESECEPVTEEELKQMLAHAIPGEQFMAEIEEMLHRGDNEGNGR
jgi:hypothetical protein